METDLPHAEAPFYGRDPPPIPLLEGGIPPVLISNLEASFKCPLVTTSFHCLHFSAHFAVCGRETSSTEASLLNTGKEEVHLCWGTLFKSESRSVSWLYMHWGEVILPNESIGKGASVRKERILHFWNMLSLWNGEREGVIKYASVSFQCFLSPD